MLARATAAALAAALAWIQVCGVEEKDSKITSCTQNRKTSWNGDISGGLLSALANFGWREALLFGDVGRRMLTEITKAASVQGIRLSWVHQPAAINLNRTEAPIVCLEEEFSCSEDFIHLLELHRAQHKMLVVTLAESSRALEQCLSGYGRSRAFFAFSLQSRTLARYQTFGLLKTFVRNEWPLGLGGSFDLRGNTLQLVTLSWMPWLGLLGCGEGGVGCRSEGILADILDSMSDMFNFTCRVDRDPSGEWGSVPANGTSFYDDDPAFRGVLGETVSGRKYDASASLWHYTHARDRWLDFTTR